MTDRDFLDARMRYLASSDDLAPELFEELRGVSSRLVRFGHLHPSQAPYGVWDDDAAEEIFAAWMEHRLLGAGGLRSILHQAANTAAFRGLAERSLRQFVLNQRTRSQSQNLFERLRELFETDSDFELAGDADRFQDRWWTLAARPQSTPIQDERLILAEAFALGDFTVVRYRADAQKLSPLLDSSELKRFVAGLLARVEGALTAPLIIRCLGARFGFDEVSFEPMSEDQEPELDTAPEPILVEETALAVVSEFTERQAEVLLGTDRGETIEDLAQRLACSDGTVVNERRRIALIVDRFTEGVPERDEVLRKVADLLYEGQED